MNKWMRTAIAVLVSLALCTAFLAVLLIYAKPFDDMTVSLSVTRETETISDGWVYDQKGWTVFIQEGEAFRELSADGNGGFSGMEAPGQTLYFSRTMEEALDGPTLRLMSEEAAVAVFLDDTLLYTDCPELDNRVGHLRLPMLEWDRTEPVVITPLWNYLKKTLTIAQGTDPGWGTEGAKLYPVSVTIYGGYAYESGLVAESFRTAVATSMAFAAGVVLLFLLVLLRIFLQITGDVNLWFSRAVSAVNLIGLLAAMICALGEWKRGSWFHHWFSLLVGIGTALWIGASVSTPPAAFAWHQFIKGTLGRIFWHLMLLAALAAMVMSIAGAIRSEVARWTQARLLAQRVEMTQNSYEAMLYFNGVDSVSISKRLGHAQVSTTANIYAHVMEEADQRNADILADVFLKKA